MANGSIELKEKRQSLLSDARTLIDNAEKEQRDLTPEESQSWETLVAESETLKANIQKSERTEYLASQENELNRSIRKVTPTPIVSTQKNKPEYRNALRAWLKADTGMLTGQDWEALNFYGFNPERHTLNIRAGQLTTDANLGANLVSPDNQFLSNIERALKDYSGILENCNVIRTSDGNPLPFPTSNDTTNLGFQIAEGVQDTTETDVNFQRVTFNAWVYSSGTIRISQEMLADSYADIQKYISDSLGERLGRVLNRDCTIGAGTTLPKGIAVAANTAVTTGAITYDNLIDLEASLDPAYQRQGASFMMHQKTLASFKKLKDSQNRPLVVDALVNGLPSKSLLGWNVNLNNDMPYTSGKVVLFGNLKKHTVRMVQEVNVVRLQELFAQYREVGFLASIRFDSNLLDAGTHPIQAINLTGS